MVRTDREIFQLRLVAAIEQHTSATVDDVVEWRSGETWNDGGSWYRIVARVGDQFWMAEMPTDYRSYDIEVRQVKRVETITVEYQ